MIFVDVEQIDGGGDGPREVELGSRVVFSQTGSINQAGRKKKL